MARGSATAATNDDGHSCLAVLTWSYLTVPALVTMNRASTIPVPVPIGTLISFFNSVPDTSTDD
ncbi:hypothetical protein D3C87_2026500 [compost metagenome]